MIFVLCCVVSAQAQQGVEVYKRAKTPSEYRGRDVLSRKWDFGWIGQAWKAPDPRYDAFRRQVDGLGKRADAEPSARRELLRLAVAQRKAALSDCWNPLQQFRHAYAAYMALQVAPGSATWSEVGMAEAIDQFRVLDFPGQPEYARTEFLIDTIPMPQPVRRRLGNRLFERDSEDRRVLHILIQVTNPNRSSEERAEAIRLADLLIRKWPNYVKGYAVRAGVYDRSFFSDHKRKEDGKLAVQGYEEFLARASDKEPWRKDAQEQISFIKSQLRNN